MEKRWEDSPTPRGRKRVWTPGDAASSEHNRTQKWPEASPRSQASQTPLLGDEAAHSSMVGHRIKKSEGRVWVAEGVVGELGVNVSTGMCSGTGTLGVTCKLRLQAPEPWSRAAASFPLDCTECLPPKLIHRKSPGPSQKGGEVPVLTSLNADAGQLTDRASGWKGAGNVGSPFLS